MCNNDLHVVNDDAPTTLHSYKPASPTIGEENSLKYVNGINTLHVVEDDRGSDVIIDQDTLILPLEDYEVSQTEVCDDIDDTVNNITSYQSEHTTPRELNNFLPSVSTMEPSISDDMINLGTRSSPGKHTESILEINQDDPASVLRVLKAKNADRPIIGHLNINFFGIKV